MLIIDRFEGDWAVLEWRGTTFKLPRRLLPENAREGDVLTVSFARDADATVARRQRVRRLEDDLFRK